MSKTWSPLQTAIFNLIEDPNGGNAIIEAVAGSGKTTTIVEGVKRARGTTIFLAFNKSIAEELKSRGVNARTFHSLTYGAVTQHKGVRTVEADKLRRMRVKLQATSCRIEVQTKIDNSNQWIRLGGDYYTNIVKLEDGRLRVGSYFFGKKVDHYGKAIAE